MTTVKATREGLVGGKTSSGYVIDNVVSFVALPNTLCLHAFVKIVNPLNNKFCFAQVLDVGPWNIDDPYPFTSDRPLSEQGIKTNGHKRITGKTNGAGIDLGECVWKALDMKDNGNVSWEFIR